MKCEITGKIIIKQESFKQNVERIDGAFKAISKAEEHLRDNNYTLGSMCGDSPIGFAKSNKINYIAKWRNISEDDYSRLSGIISVNTLNNTRNGYRDGHVTINYFKEI